MASDGVDEEKGEVATLTEGDYWGKWPRGAEPRSATIAAHGPPRARVNRIIMRLLGPLQERLAMEMTEGR